MKYTLSWQDFMRQPANKALKESKGIHVCKQKYIQEQNKMMWMDPMILNENGNVAATNPNAGVNAGGSVDFITGYQYQVSTITWNSASGNNMSGSTLFEGVNYFDIEGYDGSTDFSLSHADSMHKFRVFLTTGSKKPLTGSVGGDLNVSTAAELASLGFAGVITASVSSSALQFLGTEAGGNSYTGSIFSGIQQAINNQAGGAVVGGITCGPRKPGDVFTATLAVGAASGMSAMASGALVITNDHKARVDNTTLSYGSITVASGQQDHGATLATTTEAVDTFHSSQGSQTFNGDNAPYNGFPRKAFNAS